METNLLFGVSLTASFLAGALALFAPCCITFLFPSYLGTIFKQNQKVMFYTLVFALGLSAVLVPVALGFRFFIFLFDAYHKTIYYLGGAFLILMGVATVWPFFKIPDFFHFKQSIDKKVTVGSVFGLGFISGLSSACCAPVLFAAIALTTLSPSLLQAVVVSLAYVLGIVFPLFILSLFYKKLTGKIAGADNRKKINKIFSYLGAGTFIVSGVLILILNYLDKIQMYQTEGYSRNIRLLVFQFAKFFQNPIIDIIIFGGIILVFYKLLKIRS